jgi:dihydrofolate reductase
MNWVIENVRDAGGYLLGRGTYQSFAAHWPDASQEQQVLAEPLNTLPNMSPRRSWKHESGYR